MQPVVSLDAELAEPIDLDALDDDEREVMERAILRLAHKAAATSGPTIEHERETEAQLAGGAILDGGAGAK